MARAVFPQPHPTAPCEDGRCQDLEHDDKLESWIHEIQLASGAKNGGGADLLSHAMGAHCTFSCTPFRGNRRLRHVRRRWQSPHARTPPSLG
eukprot:12879958-Prorocentrum_lima.AAC.1